MSTAPTAEQIKATADLFQLPPCHIVRSTICGEAVLFTITRPKDHIQRSHLAGQFYEPEELAIISRFIKPGAIFCDIGANIGNHTLFALIVLKASVSIMFEPNPAAIEVLRSNLILNGLEDRVDLANLGLGLSDQAEEGFSVATAKRNLGASRLEATGGEIRTIQGDQALAGRKIDFIKIDVEGMEMKALAGLEQTIANNRPPMFIEVNSENDESFHGWVRSHEYRIADTFKRYRTNANYLIVTA